MLIAKVMVDLSLDKTYDYIIPANLASDVKPGTQVMVSFGKSKRRAYVVALAKESKFQKLKSVESLCDNQPAIPEDLMGLGKWIADYYCCAREPALRSLLPGSIRDGKIKPKTSVKYYIADEEKARRFIFTEGSKKRSQAKIVKQLLLRDGLGASHLLRSVGATRAPLKELVKSGFIIEKKEKVSQGEGTENNTVVLSSKPLVLNDEQNLALERINDVLNGESKPKVLLLHGVTGSGKTEVYLQAIATVLEKGQEVIALVPEIALTPQTLDRFIRRFGDQVSVLHSGLGERERYDEWLKIYHKKVKIVIGARSALFAPFQNLGLIIVDEEHENSYKQEETPRYHARDVAVMRGHSSGAAVILGSATPSLESYYNVSIGKYQMAELNNRVDEIPMPKIRVVDMGLEAAKNDQTQVFSQALIDGVKDRLYKKEQVMFFLNRRGFGKLMKCVHCDFVATCADCSISYTYHRSKQCLTCHLCGAIIQAPETCPECGAEDIRYAGMGTEKIEDLTAQFFPGAKIARMDADTMTRKSSYQEVLSSFRRGDIDILIGTQMIAKGHHFPKVTLVGIIYADLSLYIPDFRSLERTFQLLLQMSGRAGRGDTPGEVLIQTYSPYNPAIQYAVKHDYQGFYEEELFLRKEMLYPPVADMIIVHIRGIDEEKTLEYATQFKDALQPALSPDMQASGPTAAPVSRVKGKFRFMIIYRAIKMARFRKCLRETLLRRKRVKDIDIYADIDPMNMM